MKVKLGRIRIFPGRDTALEEQRVQTLMRSIERSDLWPGLVGRSADGGCVEIPYGRHRLEAMVRLFEEDHEVEIPVEAIDDRTMFRMAFDENDQVYNAGLLHALWVVRKTVEGYAAGVIDLEDPPPSTPKNQLRFTPSFETGVQGTSPGGGRPYTAGTVAAWLEWSDVTKVRDLLRVLAYEDREILRVEDLKGLTHQQARAVVAEAAAAEVRACPPVTAQFLEEEGSDGAAKELELLIARGREAAQEAVLNAISRTRAGKDVKNRRRRAGGSGPKVSRSPTRKTKKEPRNHPVYVRFLTRAGEFAALLDEIGDVGTEFSESERAGALRLLDQLHADHFPRVRGELRS